MSEIISVEEKALIGRYPSINDIDPVDAITAEFVNAGIPNASNWLVGINPDALNKNLEWNLRRFLVNRQLRQILGVIPEDTSNARFCLVDKGSPYVWLYLIIDTVVPVLQRNGIIPITGYIPRN